MTGPGPKGKTAYGSLHLAKRKQRICEGKGGNTGECAAPEKCGKTLGSGPDITVSEKVFQRHAAFEKQSLVPD